MLIVVRRRGLWVICCQTGSVDGRRIALTAFLSATGGFTVNGCRNLCVWRYLKWRTRWRRWQNCNASWHRGEGGRSFLKRPCLAETYLLFARMRLPSNEAICGVSRMRWQGAYRDKTAEPQKQWCEEQHPQPFEPGALFPWLHFVTLCVVWHCVKVSCVYFRQALIMPLCKMHQSQQKYS